MTSNDDVECLSCEHTAEIHHSEPEIGCLHGWLEDDGALACHCEKSYIEVVMAR